MVFNMSYFSNKIPKVKEKNFLISEFERLKKKQTVIDLTTSNPTQVGFEIPDFIGKNYSIPGYRPEPKGLWEARVAISEYYQKRGRNVDVDNIFLTSGTSEGMSYILKMLCDHKDEVCLPSPGYPLYDFITRLENVEPKYYSLVQKNHVWRIDFSSFKKCINRKTKAIVVIQPNNPTGNILTKDEIEKLLELAKEKELVIVVDEVFSDFCFGNQFTYLTSHEVPIITLNGISKIAALPQMKLAWLIIEGNSKFVKEANEMMEIIIDTYLTANTPTQYLLPKVLGNISIIQKPIQKRLNQNLKFLHVYFSNISKISILLPEGGWFVILRFHSCSDGEALSLKLLQEEFVFVYPGYFFDFFGEEYFVLSLLTPEKDFQLGVEKLSFVIGKL